MNRPEFLRTLTLPFTETQTVLDEIKQDIADVLVDASFVEELTTPSAPLLAVPKLRRRFFKIWWAYFDNKVYEPKERGGYRDLINTWLGDNATGNISPFFNPVERAVRAYEYVFDGSFGREILIADEVVEGEKISEEVKTAIKQIWKWSNINDWKNRLLTTTAALGTYGLRVVYRKTNENKVMLLPEHPDNVEFVQYDDRGNIIQLVLKYSKFEGEFYDTTGENPYRVHEYVEYMSREKFWMTKDGEWWNYTLKGGAGDFVDSKEDAEVKNVLGFVPYVLIFQNDIGGDFGVPCFYGREVQINLLNALASHITHQIKKHVTPTWLVEAGGPPPENLTMGDQNIWYVRKDVASSSQVSVKDLVSKMDLGEAIQEQDKVQAELSNSMPELKATDGEFLSHQSGGTVAELRTPAEQRILGARANIEAGFIKAQKMALSLGVLHGLWDLGAGSGSLAAMEETFVSGKEEHVFNLRPALPLTVDAQLTLAKSKQAEAAAEQPNTPKVFGGDNVPIAAPSTPTSTSTE
jgi:hypothetical protein